MATTKKEEAMRIKMILMGLLLSALFQANLAHAALLDVPKGATVLSGSGTVDNWPTGSGFWAFEDSPIDFPGFLR